jgi:patatin-like phospholipase/acyl hydrolase
MNNIKHIVLSGGGPLSLYGFGVLRELKKRNILNFNNITSIHGTSSGSILAFLIASKLNMDDISTYLKEFPYNKYYSLKFDKIVNLGIKQGLFGMKEFNTFIDPFLKTLNWDLSISLSDVKEKTGINLHIYTADFNNFSVIDFNNIDYPHISLKDALYASCAHPIMFEPHYLNLNIENKMEKTCLIDGGLFCNVPLGYCIEKYYTKNENNNTNISYNDEIFCLHYRKKYNEMKMEENYSFMKYIKLLIIKLILNSEKHVLDDLLPHIKYNCEINLKDEELDWNILFKNENVREKALTELSVYHTDTFLKTL